MRHCHTAGSSMQATVAAGKAQVRVSTSLSTHRPRSSTSTSPTTVPQPPLTAVHPLKPSSRICRHKTAAAAPDTLVTDEGVQQPSIDFLGVLNDMQTVRGILQTAADPDLVYDILTDYDSCSRVFRNISGSQTVFTDAGDKQVIQVCHSDRHLLARLAAACRWVSAVKLIGISSPAPPVGTGGSL